MQQLFLPFRRSWSSLLVVVWPLPMPPLHQHGSPPAVFAIALLSLWTHLPGRPLSHSLVILTDTHSVCKFISAILSVIFPESPPPPEQEPGDIPRAGSPAPQLRWALQGCRRCALRYDPSRGSWRGRFYRPEAQHLSTTDREQH